MSVNLRALIAKLNHHTRAAVEGAAGLCISRSHYDVEIEHFLTKLLDQTDGDVAKIFARFSVDRARLSAQLGRALDGFKTGNARNPALSPSLVQALREAWAVGSVDFGAAQVRTAHLIIALKTAPELSRLVAELGSEWDKIEGEALRKELSSIVQGSAEEAQAHAASSAAAAGGAPGATRTGDGKTPNLDQFTVDLTQRARDGKLDEVLGRDFEIRQAIDVLTRRRQNNPILVGEAGVGKTAIVEGLAMRVARDDVPPSLRGVTIRTLDLALLQAGAGVKGEFENRLKGLIEEVKSSATPILVFIDEAHTMIGAGGQAGQGDAANLLKPALARGELRTLAATTWSEYKKYFEKDPALSRRFQLIKVDEPDEDRCLLMLRGVVPALEKHHKVRILDEGLDAAVRLSHRFLPDRLLPDKAVSILDTACARLALGQNSTPSPIEDAERLLADLEVQNRVLQREAVVGHDHDERLAEIDQERATTQARLDALRTRWEEERGLVMQARELREKLEMFARGDAASEAPRAELAALLGRLETLQGETPLARVTVDAGLIGEVISGWTGIPAGKMMRDELGAVLTLEKTLGARVIGQDHALELISRRVRTSKAGIEDPNKPKGVFLLVGPSGVGKTETALAMADLLYGGETNMVTINMSEFQEPHTVSTLKGSPPGYVGYGEGGVLTEAVRRKPYSVVLLDEIEKAHPDVLELFFQVFDKGQMEDGEGRLIDFKNTIIILTTNAGTETIMKLTADPETAPSMDGLVKALKPELDKTFKPAFLGRMVIIPYYPVLDENLKQIVRLKLGKIVRRIAETHRIALRYGAELVDAVAARCTEVESGARNVDNILTNTLLPEVSRLLLEQMAAGVRLASIEVGVGDDGNLTYTAHAAAGVPAGASLPGAEAPAEEAAAAPA